MWLLLIGCNLYVMVVICDVDNIDDQPVLRWQTSTKHIHFVRALNWTMCTLYKVNTIQLQLYSGTAAALLAGYREKFSQTLLPWRCLNISALRALAIFRAHLINSFDERYKAVICNHFSTVCMYSNIMLNILAYHSVRKLVLADRNVNPSRFFFL